MSSPYDEAINQMMSDYHRQLEQLTEYQRRMSEITGTAASQRKSVSVTVGAHGQIVELKFPTDAYREMAPMELANVITETFNAARQQVTKQQQELMAANAPQGLDLSQLFGPDSDLGKVLPRNPIMSDEVREYVDNGRVPGADD
ncbi:YbaB/EbfC family nucleoid-associated protein [Kutzneria sp. NPDC052558]|uniref:YbaB/EbfC family nucleoid-associated protein n=1 Tax=Kutzneria sp. NPDC052558 TaxID=3364121 RepID=UPI0037CB1F04